MVESSKEIIQLSFPEILSARGPIHDSCFLPNATVLWLVKSFSTHLPRSFSTSHLPRSFSTSHLPRSFSTSHLPRSFSTSHLPRSFSTSHLPRSFSTSHLPRSSVAIAWWPIAIWCTLLTKMLFHCIFPLQASYLSRKNQQHFVCRKNAQ